MLSRSLFFALLFPLSCIVAAEPPPRPVRFMLHGNMSTEPPMEEHLRFIEEVQPDILVMGVFDQRLYAVGAAKAEALLTRWKEVADRLHRKNIRLIGQMEINVVSDRPLDLKESKGWFSYHDREWDEKRLGKRPAKSAADLLEEPDLDPRGKPIVPVPEGDDRALCGCRVNTKALRSCINKPAWRETQKRMVSEAIKIGVDGFMTNRNYFGHCACAHCRAGFRQWMSDRHPAEERKRLFGLTSLDAPSLVCVVGAHREIDTVPEALVLEKQRFIKHRVKDFFDDVYTRHGRKQRGDLFVAQWNHLGLFDELHLDRGHLPISTRTTFAHAGADERWGLPPELWGKDESLIWYCNWGTTQNTILEKQYAGDTVLYGKYVRALSGGKPYTINKYDFYRPRNMMAEAAAMGYATNAIATPWQSEADRDVMLRYFHFLKKHDALYRPVESFAEIGLLFPRRAVHAGDATSLEYVEAAGRALLRRHVLFDMLPDDMLPSFALSSYRSLIVTGEEYLTKADQALLTKYVEGGGKLLVLPVTREDRDRPGACSTSARLLRTNPGLPEGTVTVEKGRTEPEAFVKALERAVGDRLSTFDAPWTVEAHAYRQPASKQMVVHLVNYNHKEKATGKSVVEREAPLEAEPVTIRLRLPEKFRVGKVRFLSPDDDKEHAVVFQQRDGVLECRTPKFLVYGVCVISD